MGSYSVMMSVFAGLFFAWPVAGRFFGLPPVQTTIAVSLGTLVYAMIWNIIGSDEASSSVPTEKMILATAILGGMNGVGMFFYTNVASGRIGNAAVLTTITVVSILVFLVVGNTLAHGDIMNPTKYLGIAVIIAGVVLLSL